MSWWNFQCIKFFPSGSVGLPLSDWPLAVVFDVVDRVTSEIEALQESVWVDAV